jgi:hypothetical protein
VLEERFLKISTFLKKNPCCGRPGYYFFRLLSLLLGKGSLEELVYAAKSTLM